MSLVKRPTINDVAAEAGVSTASVSNYLNDKPGIGPETRKKISMAIEKLGYISRGTGQSTSARMFGLIMESLSFPAFTSSLYLPVLEGFEKVASESRYHTVLVTIDTQNGISLPKAVSECQYDGLAALGGGDLTDAHLEAIENTGVPLVLIDNYSLRKPMHAVVPDNELGAYFAVNHLIERGHRQIAIINGPLKYKTLTDRFLGYMRAMFEVGMPPAPELIQPSISQGFPNKGYREMKALLTLPERPTAVFCVSDRTAFHAMTAIKEAGLKVPDDIAIVGFDDAPEAQNSDPLLTTVHLPKWEMGALAAQLLIDLLREKSGKSDPVRIVLPTSLIIRSST